MPQGDKDKYTAKQKRMAKHIEESYKEDGASKKKAESIAWATVNKKDGGGLKSDGGGTQSPATKSARSDAAKRGWETRRANKEG